MVERELEPIVSDTRLLRYRLSLLASLHERNFPTLEALIISCAEDTVQQLRGTEVMLSIRHPEHSNEPHDNNGSEPKRVKFWGLSIVETGWQAEFKRIPEGTPLKEGIDHVIIDSIE